LFSLIGVIFNIVFIVFYLVFFLFIIDCRLGFLGGGLNGVGVSLTFLWWRS
jgi:hypothetical protein